MKDKLINILVKLNKYSVKNLKKICQHELFILHIKVNYNYYNSFNGLKRFLKILPLKLKIISIRLFDILIYIFISILTLFLYKK